MGLFKDKKNEVDGEGLTLPVLPLRDLVVFPHMVVPLIVGRTQSRAALSAAHRADGRILLLTQREGRTTNPDLDELHAIGTIGTVLQMVPLPDDNIKVLVEGHQRVQVDRMVSDGDYLRVAVSVLEAIRNEDKDPQEFDALMRSVRSAFEEYVQLAKGIPSEIISNITGIEDPSKLTDTLAAHLGLKVGTRQALLEELDPVKRLGRILGYIQSEVEILQVERKIKRRVKKQMERSQKEYYLNEQMQAIQKELGDKDEFKADLAEMARRISETMLSEEAEERLIKELKKLGKMNPMSAEANVVRTYMDAVLALPWQVFTEEQKDLEAAAEILNEDHHGLKKVKERILEHLAVSTLVERIKGPILCLVGPPGVGKTSLAQSIARATGRNYVRQALGGVRDEAEIRGHRRTYIGALPGKVIQCLKKAESANPLFLLDEIDKMSTDFRGDPSAALLEVLDPEQNHCFNDHYLDLDFDLSRVMFLCTANTLQGIPVPLQDRLEIIRLPGYTEREKLSIARRYLIPKQLDATGLTTDNLMVTRQAMERTIREYTRESGVRGLEREIASLCRKVAKRKVWTGKDVHVRVSGDNLPKLLGIPKFVDPAKDESSQVGVVNGLAVTPWGGSMLEIEVAIVPGKGKLILTGRLGDWLKESATAGFSYVRSRTAMLGLDEDFHEKFDLHIHYPGNALKTDGPSAGIAMATALTSALTGIPVRRDIAMTGEISLRGRVLPIGGLKEKTLAAHRGDVRLVILPETNRKDIEDIPRGIRDELMLEPVSHMDQVLELALDWPDGAPRFTEQAEGLTAEKRLDSSGAPEDVEGLGEEARMAPQIGGPEQ